MRDEKRILIVDDEASFRTELARLFIRQGYRVADAANGKEALEVAALKQLDVVLLDIVLPDIFGIEVLESLKERSPDTQVIIITANANVNNAIASITSLHRVAIPRGCCRQARVSCTAGDQGVWDHRCGLVVVRRRADAEGRGGTAQNSEEGSGTVGGGEVTSGVQERLRRPRRRTGDRPVLQAHRENFSGMHELAIAESIYRVVEEERIRRRLGSVQTVVVRVGALSGVVPEALEFSFEAIITDTPLADTRLEIEWIPIQGECRDCGREFDVEDLLFACPFCTSAQIEITRGTELDIAYLEVES